MSSTPIRDDNANPLQPTSSPHDPKLALDPALDAMISQHGILYTLQDAVIISDLVFRIVGWNPAAEALYGWSAAETIGQSVRTLLGMELLGRTSEEIVQEFWVQGVWKGELFQRHREGHAIAIIATVTLVRNSSGEPVGIVSVNRDISERRAAEAQLRAYTSRLELLTEASRAFAEVGMHYELLLDIVVQHIANLLNCACIVCLVSDDGRWLAPAALYDHNTDALEFMRAIFASNPLPVESMHPLVQAFRNGQSQLIPQVEPERLRAMLTPEYWPAIDHYRIHSLVIAPLRVQGQTIGVIGLTRRDAEQGNFTTLDQDLVQDLADRAALAIANAHLFRQAHHDLADRRRAEQALSAERALLSRRVTERTADLSRANAELSRAVRLKDEFLTTMSHELRTPLNAILARTEALQEGIYGPIVAKQNEVLRGIEESGRHLLTLINDILDLSKIEAGQLELEHTRLDVALLCHMSLRLISQLALTKRIMISSVFDTQVQTIMADERRLKQILVNLLSNAVKFTPNGGTVSLEVQGNPEQQTATFIIRDTGIGIAADDLPKLFEPFVQLDSSLSREYTGTGLGLSLVLRLTQAHGGSVTVESSPGQGSIFSVTLPWLPETRAAEPAHLTVSAAVDTTMPAIGRALVIEDSLTTAEQIRRYLQELSAQVEIHPYGRGAIEQATTLQPDLIILDILLPDLNGWDLLRQLKTNPSTKAIPVVVVSVVNEPERVQELGAAAMLVKPIDRPSLVQTLRQVLAHLHQPLAQNAIAIPTDPQRPRVLLAEDNEANSEVILDYLQAKGYDLLIVRNGHEALIRVQEEQPDVILMDIQMPGMDGLEAIQRIRADTNLRQAPIIALTALAMPGDRERCLAAGADAYLAKPVHLQALLALIESLRQQ